MFSGNDNQVTMPKSQAALRLAFEADDRIIRRGAQTFREVGEALTRVRDTRSYEAAGYSSFEAYAESVTGFSRQRAYQLMDSVKLIKELPPELSTRVDNEKTARELKKHEAARRVEIIKTANAKGRKLTPAVVREATSSDAEPESEPEPIKPARPVPGGPLPPEQWQREAWGYAAYRPNGSYVWNSFAREKTKTLDAAIRSKNRGGEQATWAELQKLGYHVIPVRLVRRTDLHFSEKRSALSDPFDPTAPRPAA